MLEREMEDLIAAHPDHFFPRHGLVLEGRQQSFQGVGRFDLLFRDRYGMKILMELKAVPAGYEAVDQVARYRDAIASSGVTNVLMWIVAPSIPTSMRQFLSHLGIEFTEISELEFVRAASLFNYVVTSTPPNEKHHELAPICIGEQWGLIDRSGRVAIPPKFFHLGDFSEGLASASTSKSSALKGLGYIDISGNFVINPQFDEAGDFREGQAIARIWNEDREEYEWGYIDRKTRRYVREDWCENYQSQRYEDVMEVERNLSAGRNPDGYPTQHVCDYSLVYRSKHGQILDQHEFHSTSEFSEGLAVVSLAAGAYGVIDVAMNFVVTPQYEAICNYSDGLAAFKTGGMWGFIDRSGARIIGATFDNYAWGFEGGLACVSQKGLFGIIDKSGTFCAEPRFNGIKPFRRGLAAAQDVSGKWGYIDKKGRVGIPFKFDGAGDFFSTG